MRMMEVDNDAPPLDIIVEAKDDWVKVELDVRTNEQVKVGDSYTARLTDGARAILQITSFETEGYDHVTARRTTAMREGVAGVPSSRAAREEFQRKLAIMRVVGELLPNGQRRVGALRLPDRLIPVEPITDDALEEFTVTPSGDVILGNLRSSSRVLNRPARIAHNFAGDRMVICGMPGKGKTQLDKGLLTQLMAKPKGIGVLVLDRAGEYIEDSEDQRGNVFGLQHHPHAPERMVVLSRRKKFLETEKRSGIAASMELIFNIQDIELIDLLDFYQGFTQERRNLLRDYSHIQDIYQKLLKETRFGLIDQREWFRTFSGLFEVREKGKKLLKEFEKNATQEGRHDYKDEELEQLENHLGGTKPGVLERAILDIKRFCQNPLFGEKSRGPDILAVQSCVGHVLKHLEQGHVVFIDLKGIRDEDYILISALFARRLLTENKRRDDQDQIRCCIMMEEAHNILAEEELYKGAGNGSVFIELAREGRKLKLGFVLVTQHPDSRRSIASEIANTIDTVIAFNMSPDNAKTLARLKSGFSGLELQIANAAEFEGIAIADAGPVAFRSGPITPEYMQVCAAGRLESYIKDRVPAEEPSSAGKPVGGPPAVEDRLNRLMQQRAQRYQYQEQLTATMEAWAKPSGEETILDDEDE
jgi:hypothetical protein